MSATLKETRVKNGLSLKELAELSGIGRSTLGNYELGLTRMSAEKIAHLAKCLKTNPENIRPQSAMPEASDQEMPVACRLPEGCDLPARLEAIERQMDDMRKLLVSLLAAERGGGVGGASGEVNDKREKAG